MNAELAREIIAAWGVHGAPQHDQVVVLFERVRDIRYGDIGSRDPEAVYRRGVGTCSGKHELLKALYHELGIETQDWIAMHRFNNLPVEFPTAIREILDRTEIIDPHNFFKIPVNGRWTTIDVTWDLPLRRLGFPVTVDWDGWSEMDVCVTADEVFETDDPLGRKRALIEALPEVVRADRKLFLTRLTTWLETQR